MDQVELTANPWCCFLFWHRNRGIQSHGGCKYACTTEFLSELLVQSIKEVSADIPICLIRRVFRRELSWDPKSFISS